MCCTVVATRHGSSFWFLPSVYFLSLITFLHWPVSVTGVKSGDSWLGGNCLTSHGRCDKSESPSISQTLNLHWALQFFNLYCKSLKLRINMKIQMYLQEKRLPSVSYGELHQPLPYALQHQCSQPSLWFQQQMWWSHQQHNPLQKNEDWVSWTQYLNSN